MQSHSQAGQDIFVRALTNYKRGGFFLEIGSNDPIYNNNTYILEKEYDYKGIMIEYDQSFEEHYKLNRPNSIYVINDAQKINYAELLENNNFPLELDYLQIDLDVNNCSTLNTLELLDRTVFDKYKFATITFEHDIYTGDFFDTYEKSRKIFKERGYVLLFPDVELYWSGTYNKFEDWYVHPSLIDKNIIDKLKSDKGLPYEEITRQLLELIPNETKQLDVT